MGPARRLRPRRDHDPRIAVLHPRRHRPLTGAASCGAMPPDPDGENPASRARRSGSGVGASHGDTRPGARRARIMNDWEGLRSTAVIAVWLTVAGGALMATIWFIGG